jgi:tripartite-type tricarboxylate transporter receptor subunit TctC
MPMNWISRARALISGERRRVTVLLFSGLTIIAAAALWFPIFESAQAAFPNRSMRVIVPFGAGGVADITVRIVVEKLGEILGQRLVVENQPGAGGISAARSALAAPADGYTLTLLTNGTAISVQLFKTFPFNPVKDFEPISTLGYFDWIVAVNATSPFRTLPDFLKVAAQKPGELNVGTVSVGSSQHLSAELLKSSTGTKFAIIHYRSTSELIVALLRDDIQVTVDSYAALKSPLTDRKIRAIASSGATRSEILPDVPTVGENGTSGFEVISWNGLFAPAGTPPEIVAVLNQGLRKALADADVKKRLLDLGIEAKPSTPEELRSRLQADIKKWARVIEQAGIPQQ